MIFYTGDLHGQWDISKLNNKRTKEITSKDVLIIAGDLGLVWNFAEEKTNKNLRDSLDKKPYDILFCDGNHENFDRLQSDEFPEVEKYGGKVKQISKRIFELQTGHVYEIQGKKVFSFGGAMSIDKLGRTPNVSWWEQEIPSCTTFYMGLKNLEAVGNKVDIVISHATNKDCYDKALKLMPAISNKESDPVITMLQVFKKSIEYDMWVSGHYHLNCFDGDSKTAILYNIVISNDNLKNIIYNNKDSILLEKL